MGFPIDVFSKIKIFFISETRGILGNQVTSLVFPSFLGYLKVTFTFTEVTFLYLQT